jgi:hypothetical protein
MSVSIWSFLKSVFWGSSGDPKGDTRNYPSGDMTEVDTTATTEPQHCSLSALPFYDENLLDRCITQWKFGDWQSLIQITKEQLEHHPEREKLAILVAASHFQIGSINVGKEFTQTAMTWGCSQRLVSQILIAGVHNSLGRAAVSSQEPERALSHFNEAITVGAPKSEVTLFVQARSAEQTRQLSAHSLPQALPNSQAQSAV